MSSLKEIFIMILLIFSMFVVVISPISAEEISATYEIEHYSEDGFLELVSRHNIDDDSIIELDVYDTNGDLVGEVSYEDSNIYIKFDDSSSMTLHKVSDSLVLDENGEKVLEIIDKEDQKKESYLNRTLARSTPKPPYSNTGGYYWLYEKTVKFKSPSAQERVARVVAAAALGTFPGLVGKIVSTIIFLVDIKQAIKPTDPVYVVVDYFQSTKTWISFTSKFYKYNYSSGLMYTTISPIYHY